MYNALLHVVLVRDSGLPQQRTKTTFDIVINKSTPKRRPPPPTAPPPGTAHSEKLSASGGGMDLESAPFKVLFSLLVLVIVVVGIAGFSTCVYLKCNMPVKHRTFSMAFPRKQQPKSRLGQKASNMSDEQKQLTEKLLQTRATAGGDKELQQPPPAAFYAPGSQYLGGMGPFSQFIPLGAAAEVDPDEIVALDADGVPITHGEYMEILNQELPLPASGANGAEGEQSLDELLEVVDEAGNTIAIPIDPDDPSEPQQSRGAARASKRSPDRELTPSSDQRNTPGSHKSSSPMDMGHVSSYT